MENLPKITRRRIWLILGLLIVIPLGLASRKHGAVLPVFLAENAGDALWTMAVYLSLAICRPHWSAVRLGCLALVISFAVEFAQLLDWNWLNTLRKTLPGRLLMGSGFLWIDLIRYAFGAIIVATIDQTLILSKKLTQKLLKPAQ
jgi:hypothetical protein